MTCLRLAAATLLLSLASPLAAQQVEGDPITEVEQGDPVMTAAYAEAQATLPKWLALMEDPPRGYSDFSFKFPLAGWEHIWVSNVTREGEELVGQLANNPHSKGYALGDWVRVPISAVTDWSYWDERGVAHGYFTTRALFPRMDKNEVAGLKASFGWE